MPRPLTHRLLPWLTGLALLTAQPLQAQLSPTAQRDLLLVQMAQAAEALKHHDYLDLLERYKALGGEVELEMRYFEAQAYAETGEPLKARNTVSAFINAAGNRHPLYTQALGLYTRVQAAAEAEETELRQQEANRQARLARQRQLLDNTPLILALTAGHNRIQAQPFGTPSPWDDRTSTFDLPNWNASYSNQRDRSRNHHLQSVELHRGIVPLPDGGWFSYGHRPDPAPAPQNWSYVPHAGLMRPEYAPFQSTHPPASLMRFGSDGQLAWTWSPDWKKLTAQLIASSAPRRTLGIYTQTNREGSPGRHRISSLVPEYHQGHPQVRRGDIITHVNGGALSAEEGLDAHLDTWRYRNANISRLTLMRPGEDAPIQVDVPVIQSQLSETWNARNTLWPHTALARSHAVVGLFTNNLNNHNASGRGWSWTSHIGERDYREWASQAVAMRPISDKRARVCANLDMSITWTGPDHGHLLSQTGVWFDIELQPNGVTIVNAVEPWATSDVTGWMMPNDHPDKNSWYDSGILDCVVLPDGATLIASRATAYVHRAPLQNQRTNVYLPVARRDQLAQRAIRIIEPSGFVRATRFVNLPDMSPDPQHHYTLWSQHRFQPAAEGEGWVWQFGPWRVDARDGQLAVADGDAAAVSARPASNQTSSWHRLRVGTREIDLLPAQAANGMWVKGWEKRDDGSYLVLLSFAMADDTLNAQLPAGGAIGDHEEVHLLREAGLSESRLDPPRQSSYNWDPAQTWWQKRKLAPFRNAESFVLAVDPSQAEPLRWAYRLTGGPIFTTVDEKTFGLYHILWRRSIMREWVNLARLPDGSVLVQMAMGEGLRLRLPD